MVSVTTWIAALLFHCLFCWQEKKKKPPNSWVPVVLMTSVLFMFCIESWWMIKCVWDKAVGNTLSVTVGNVPELHCSQFFTISLLERGIQSLILFPSSPVSPLQWIIVRSLPEMGSFPQLPPGLELGGVRSILWDNRAWLGAGAWWGCADAVLELSRKLWAWSRGKGKKQQLFPAQLCGDSCPRL